jgi:hypothetical protein
MHMAKREVQKAEFLSLPKACQRIGCSMSLANKLVKTEGADFPPWFWLGGRRVVSTRRLDRWLAEKHGEDIAP